MSRKMLKVCVLVLGLTVMMGFMTKTVSGKEQKTSSISTEILDCMETECIKEVKTVLSDYHFSNSGVNMTKVIDADDNRFYTVEIYHTRLLKADPETRQEVLDQLKRLEGFGEYGTVEYKIAL